MPSIVKPGRNDPCPCGSGKKFKNCCLAAEQDNRVSPEALTWTRLRRLTADLPQRMARFIEEAYGPDAFEEGWDDFTLWEGDEFDPGTPLLPLFIRWLFHSWRPLDDTSVDDESLYERPPTRAFLERHGRRLDPLLRRYLEACLAAPFSFHEVVRCDRGRGFLSRDVITGEEHEVLERSASMTFDQGDIVYGQLVPIDGIVLLEASSPYVLPPGDKIPIIELRAQIAAYPEEEPDSDVRQGWEIEIRELYHALVNRILNPERPVLHNTDGELVMPQRLTFEIDSADTAFAALAHLAPGETAEALLERAERGADGAIERVRFDWRKAGNRMHASWDNTVLGNLEITRSELVAHVNSEERADALRAIVEQTLGASARYRGSEVPLEESDWSEESSDEDEDEMGDAQLLDSPEAREQIQRFLAAHYDDWPTQEIPALGNRRPIDAVKDAEGREKVEALVLDMERHAQHMGPPADEAIFRRLRERLGLATRS